MMRRRDFLLSSARSLAAAAVGTTFLSSRMAVAAPDQNALAGTIALNQLGYLPSQPKMASVRGNAASFVIRSAKNAVALQGKLGEARADAASGDTLRSVDFSALTKPGSYVLELDTGERSDAFQIGRDVYHDALRLAMRSYYGQRCGCAVDLGGGYAHPACHMSAGYHASSGKSGALQNHGGWHDAGDYGRYIVNAAVSTATLLWAWELYQPVLKTLGLQIPESGGKLPDYLAEIRWNLDWILTLQDDDGGVWHKQTSLQFCGFIMPQADTLTSYVIGTGEPAYKGTCASADFAAVMAVAARCYGSYDSEYAKRCLDAARKAWAWSVKHPDVTFHNPPDVGTGEYGDTDCADEMLWAAGELWRTTGDDEYEKFFASAAGKGDEIKIAAPDWSGVSPLGYWSYALSERKDAAGLRSAIQQATVKAAESLVANSNSNGYDNTLTETDYVWGSNGVAGNQALLLLVANHFHPDSSFVHAALNNLHYLLGRNCFSLSWVTQVGTRSFQHPHHRPSAADGITAPWPGLLSGGPNRRPADPVAKTLAMAPPMRMYVDDSGAYSMNEIAINWNAPLVFLLAAANSL
ncbi:glycoside hydrolase family 9 protein [Acidobacterium sp. S8]|uniref:glycoside hydrolase family 9 protein n=1 Tax=Acidobacterium sp. S8 TaxID=1641854 RepID=UPI00131D7A14|nr:glycoside hydrolase family 9 protein [Acidobacterium sp. S8]